MKGINVVVIDGKEVELKTLQKDERERLAREWNHRGLIAIGYARVESR